MTLVDTNVLLDVYTDEPTWADWAIIQLEAAALRGPIAINDIIYSEFSTRFVEFEAVEDFIDKAGFVMSVMPRTALFLAAKAFTRYRRAGGTRTGVLPDFFIGAHAAVLGCPLLTRDRSRYRSYFPSIKVVCPGE